MKTLKQITLIGLITIFILSCSKIKESANNKVYISGKIKNFTTKTVVLYHDNIKSHTFELDENGMFSDTISINKPSLYTFSNSNISASIYLPLGSDLQISVDINDFDASLSFEGNCAASNTYLAKKYLLQEKYEGDGMKLYLEDSDNFDKLLTEYVGALKESLVEDGAINERFRNLEMRAIESKRSLFKMSYPTYKAMINGDDDYTIPDGLIESNMDTSNNEELYEFSEEYAALKKSTLMQFAYKKMLENNWEKEQYIYQIIEDVKVLEFKPLKEDVITEVLYEINSSFNGDLNKITKDLAEMTTNPETLDLIQSKLIPSETDRGEQSPVFTNLPDTNDNLYSLGDFKGKYVYIDVWATWCGPCLEEIPFLKEVKLLYKDKNIVFIGLSLDKSKDKEKWKRFVEKEKLDGVQLIAENAFEDPFVKGYNIEGIPRFILIDPNGAIVSENAPSPSNKKFLFKLFDSLEM